MQNLSRADVMKVLCYSPDTGELRWRVTTAPRSQKGCLAGNINDKGYLRIGLKGRQYLAHRVAWLYMTGAWPEHEIDHINHVRADNRFSNLRVVTHAENAKNQSLHCVNKTGRIGVTQCKKTGKWKVHLDSGGKRITRSGFASMEEAAEVRARLEAEFGFHSSHGAKSSNKYA